jgi:uncharacterized protein YggE
VQASAKRDIRPDLATVTLDFSALGSSPLAAGRTLAARADSLRRAFQTLGIPRDSLISQDRWYWWRGRVEQVMGTVRYVAAPDPRQPGIPQQDTLYRAYDAILVRIHDLTKVGAVIDTALAHGILQISNPTFAATKTDGLREELLREATVQARRQATAIAEAAGSHLGTLIYLGTDPGPLSSWGSELAFQSAGGLVEPQGTQVIQPSVTVSVTVYGRWALKTGE